MSVMTSDNRIICPLKAVVLAAGKGTRLYPITKIIPKPLLPIANRITLEYAFDQLKALGIYEICLVVGESEEYIREVLGDGSQYEIQLTYVRQQGQFGLAHALKSAKDFVDNGPFVLYLGDAVYTGDFKKAAQKFIDSDIENLNVVQWVEDPKRFGVAEIKGDSILGLEEKPENPKSNYVMAGLYFFRSKIWDILESLPLSQRGEYEITDAIKTLIDQGYDVKAEIHEGAWFDTGTLNSFIDTNEHMIGDDILIHPSAQVKAKLGKCVVIGENAVVECDYIDKTVVLAGTKVNVKGTISNSLISGMINEQTSIEGQILSGKSI